MSELRNNRCAGSQAFPTSYNGEHTRCPVCNRRLKLHVNGKVPTHNAAVVACTDNQPQEGRGDDE